MNKKCLIIFLAITMLTCFLLSQQINRNQIERESLELKKEYDELKKLESIIKSELKDCERKENELKAAVFRLDSGTNALEKDRASLDQERSRIQQAIAFHNSRLPGRVL